MTEGICNKCGERKELVVAGCVCRSCSDLLDNQLKTVTATDWVLIAASSEQGLYPPSIVTVMSVIQGLKDERDRGIGPSGQLAANAAEEDFPPLGCLNFTSPEAELFATLEPD